MTISYFACRQEEGRRFTGAKRPQDRNLGMGYEDYALLKAVAISLNGKDGDSAVAKAGKKAPKKGTKIPMPGMGKKGC